MCAENFQLHSEHTMAKLGSMFNLSFFLMAVIYPVVIVDGLSYVSVDKNWMYAVPGDVTDLYLSGDYLTGNVSVPCLQNLSSLTTDKNKISIIHFQCVESSLQEFEMTSTPTRILPNFDGMNTLTVVHISDTRITAIDATIMTPNVTDFSLTNSKLWRLHEKAFAAMAKLKLLSLSNNFISVFPDLSFCSQLVSLFIDGNELTNVSDNALINMVQLDVLKLNNNNLQGAFYLPGLALLTTLYLNHNSLTEIVFVNAVVGVTNWPMLKMLYLHFNKLSGKMTVPYLPALLKFRLDTNELSEFVCQDSLACLPVMTALWLDHNAFSGTYTTPCFPKLGFFYMRENELTGFDFQSGDVLTCLPLVKYVTLNYNSFQQIPDSLLLLPKLNQLLMQNNKISTLSQTLCLSTVLNLYLEDNYLTTFDISCISMGNGYLKTMALSSNPIKYLQVDGFQTVTDIDVENTQMNFVNLNLPVLQNFRASGNQLTDLSFITTIVSSLKFLDISRNNLKDISILSTVTLHNGLELHLESNIIEAFNWFDKPNLQRPYLDKNKLSGKLAVPCNSSITALSLAYNNVSQVEILCSENSQLQSVNIEGNNVTDIGTIFNVPNLKDFTYTNSKLVDLQKVLHCGVPNITNIVLFNNTGSSLSFSVWKTLTDITISTGDLEQLTLNFCQYTDVNVSISYNPLKLLPLVFGGNIVELKLDSTQLQIIPDVMPYPTLTQLQIENGILGTISIKAFDAASVLRHISLQNNALFSFPQFSTCAHVLTYLDLSRNQIRRMNQTDLWGFSNLVDLKMNDNLLTVLNVPYLPSVKTMLFARNQLTAVAFGYMMFELLPSLEILDLSDNRLTNLSGFFLHTPQLQKVDMANNLFISIPDVYTLSATLTYLDLDDCQLANVEGVFGMEVLEELHVCNNPFNGSLLVKNMPLLHSLYCDRSNLTSLTLRNLSNLEQVTCMETPMTRIPNVYDVESDFQLNINLLGCPIPWISYSELHVDVQVQLIMDSLRCDLTACSVVVGYPQMREKLTCTQHGNHTAMTSLTKESLHCEGRSSI